MPKAPWRVSDPAGAIPEEAGNIAETGTRIQQGQPGRAEPAAQGLSVATHGAPAAPDGARNAPVQAAHVQIATAIQRKESDQFVLSLDPPELGEVKITLSSRDGVMSVSIHSDRPDTTALLRRHLEHLEAELLDAGYSNLDFSFSSGQEKDARQEPAPAAEFSVPAEGRSAAEEMRKPAAGYALSPHSTMDIRI
nr:flagellar hook-length control protein FliK [Mangrovicoccus algicola]